MAKNNSEPPTELDPVEARQGVIVGPMRYVLGFGLGGAIVALLVAWFIFG